MASSPLHTASNPGQLPRKVLQPSTRFDGRRKRRGQRTRENADRRAHVLSLCGRLFDPVLDGVASMGCPR